MTKENDFLKNLSSESVAFLNNINVGDKVIINCDESPITTNKTEEVTEILIRFDKITGDPYRVICCNDHHFDGRHGGAITQPITYSIMSIVKEEKE